MKIALLGPTRIDKFCELKNIQDFELETFFDDLSKQLLNHEILVVPEPNSFQEKVINYYRDYKGTRVIGIVPFEDEEFGYDWLNQDMVDETINCKDWRNQPETLCENADLLLVMALSPGTMIEICYAKWFKKKVIILNNFIKSIPEEIEKDINPVYCSIKNLGDHL